MRLPEGGIDIFYIDESMDRSVFAMSAVAIPFLRDVDGTWSLVWEDQFENLQPVVEARAVELYKENPVAAREYLTKYSNEMAQAVVDDWWALSDYLVMKYNDGYINSSGERKSVGHPKEWLDLVGYGKKKIQKPKKPTE